MDEPVPIPRLAGSLVTLRPQTLDDLEAVVERCTDPESIRWTTVPTPYSPEMAAEYLGGNMQPSPGQTSWAVEFHGRYAGTIDLRAWTREPGHGAGNLGFVTPSARARGLMSQAVWLVAAHALDTLGWELLAWQANVGNVGSYKAVWCNGFPVPVMVPAL